MNSSSPHDDEDEDDEDEGSEGSIQQILPPSDDVFDLQDDWTSQPGPKERKRGRSDSASKVRCNVNFVRCADEDFAVRILYQSESDVEGEGEEHEPQRSKREMGKAPLKALKPKVRSASFGLLLVLITFASAPIQVEEAQARCQAGTR